MTQRRKGFWDWYKVWILPGFILQSILIGGGYASGREVVEYFTSYAGSGAGAFVLTFLIFAVCAAATFEICRVFKAYDYRRFFKMFLGKGWPAFEVLYIVMLILVLAIVMAAGGSALAGATNISRWWGVALVGIPVLALCYRGRSAIEGYMGIFSVYLYGVYIAIIAAMIVGFSPQISANLHLGESGWGLSGFKYGMYNLVVMVGLLFALDVFKTRKQAIGSGIVASAIGVVPGIFVWISTIAFYPEIKEVTVPTLFLTTKLGLGFVIAYMIMLIATLIETGVGLLHAFNQRMDSWLFDFRAVHLTGWQRLALTAVMLGAGIGLSTFGLVPLVAKGYGTICWGFFAIFFIPVVTLGFFRAFHPEWKAEFWSRAAK